MGKVKISNYNLFCLKCKNYFEMNKDVNLDEIKCPKCGAYEVVVEIPLPDKPVMNYFS